MAATLGLVGGVADALAQSRVEHRLVDVHHATALADVDGAHYLVGNDGYGVDHVLDEPCAAYGVVGGVLHQQLGLELDEVGLVVGDELQEVFGRVRLGERVGVFAVGQQDDLDVHAFGQNHVDAAQRRLDAGRVAVVEHRHVLGEAADELYLALRQRRAAGGHHVGYAGLVHADDVGVALDEEAAVAPHYLGLGVVDAVDDAALVVELRLGRVEIFGRLGRLLHHASAEGHHLARKVVDGEDDAAEEAVGAVAVLFAHDGHAGLFEEFELERVGQGVGRQGVAARGRVAEAEEADDVVAEAAAAEIAEAHRLPLVGLPQAALEKSGGIVGDGHHALAVAAQLLLLGRHGLVDHLDVELGAQIFDRLHKGQVLLLHHEVERVAGLAASEAFEDALGRRHGERARLLVVERTAAHIVGAALAERHEVGHHVDDAAVGRVEHIIDHRSIYHCRAGLACCVSAP